MRKNKNKRQPAKRKAASQTQNSKRPRSDSPKRTESPQLTPFEIFFKEVSDAHLSIENKVSAFDTRLSLTEMLYRDSTL